MSVVNAVWSFAAPAHKQPPTPSETDVYIGLLEQFNILMLVVGGVAITAALIAAFVSDRR